MKPAPGTPSPDRQPPSRRTFLQGSALAMLAWTLAGCTGDDSGPGIGGATLSTSPDPTAVATQADIRLTLAAIASERAALAFTESASTRFPRQRDTLAPLVAMMTAHVTRLEAALFRVRVPNAVPPQHVPHQVAELMPALVALEGRLASDRATDCLAASSGPLAEVFASLRASHAVQATVLGDVAFAPVAVVPPRAVRDITPLTTCLAAEYAAVFGYGVIGGVVEAGVSDGPIATRASVAYDLHRSRRDAIVNLFTAAGKRPPAALPAYRIPFQVDGPPSARRLARGIESRCAAVYVRAVGGTVGDGRRFASDVVTECAESAVAWGAVTTAFPGLPDLPHRID